MISVSLFDWGGVQNNGVSAILSLNIDDKIYKFIYWFNKVGDFRLIADDEFKDDYNIENIYEMEFSLILMKYVDDNILPKKEEIFKTFNII